MPACTSVESFPVSQSHLDNTFYQSYVNIHYGFVGSKSSEINSIHKKHTKPYSYHWSR